MLKARLGSVAELKKAIRELRRQVRQVKREVIKRSEPAKGKEGNRGFIIKDGKPTTLPRIRIEVETLPQEQ